MTERDEWISSDGCVQVFCGDCLDILPALEAGSIHAVVTDPPYCSGARTSAAVVQRAAMTRGKRWAGMPLDCDRMTSIGFVWLIRHVAIECGRLLPDGGSLLSFVDWRQYPNAYAAIESANLRIRAMVVWNKMSLGMGNGFRNQHELIIHAAKGVPRVLDRSVPNVLEFRRATSEIHPTEKPVGLLEKLISVVSTRGDVVLNPFLGSGSTGVACVISGRRFIGIERNRDYFDVAVRRIQNATHDGSGDLLSAIEHSTLFENGGNLGGK